jgi:hypothetical protein
MGRSSDDLIFLQKIIHQIVRDLEKRHNILLNDKARQRLNEGFMHTIRALFFLALLDLDHFRFERQSLRNLDLRGRWEPLSARVVDHLPIILSKKTGLGAKSNHQRIAEELEERYHLSTYMGLRLARPRATVRCQGL